MSSQQTPAAFKRDNVAIYADIEHDVSDAFLVQYAARYENYSDFGGTLNGKIAARYRISDAFALRGAVSTGFHAPTPGQSNVSTIITTFDGTTGQQVEEGLLPVEQPGRAGRRSNGIDRGNLHQPQRRLLVGYRRLRFHHGGYLPDRSFRSHLPYRRPSAGDPIRSRSVSFYTNALDVEHQGLDVVATSSFDIGSATSLDLSLAYAYNTVEVTGQKIINGNQPVNDGLVEDIENNYPEHRWTLTGNFLIGENFNVMSRINFFGEHYDERGRIGVGDGESALIDSTYYVDIEAGWNVNDNWRVVLGGSNIFDEYIDEIGPPNANRLSVGLQYPRRTVANYEGGSWYLKGIYNW